MAIIIDGTNGVSGVDGSAATPAVQGTDANTGLFFPAADTIAFTEGGAEAMRIDSSGNVGIGTSSPSTNLNIYNATSAIISVDGDAGTSFRGSRYSSDASAALFTARKARGTLASPTAVNSGDGVGQFICSAYGGSNFRQIATINGVVDTYTSDTNISGTLIFSTNGGSTAVTERMRITSNGAIAFSGASSFGTSGQVLQSNGDAAPTWTTPSAGFSNMQVYTSGTNTWTVPAGVTKAKVTVVGGGGGGTQTTTNIGGGGGGAAIKLVTGLTPGNTVTVTIGGGGNGGTSSGSTGGTSSFGAFCSATGGGGGNVNGATGGIGSGGDLNIRGGGGSSNRGGNSLLGGTSSGVSGVAASQYGGGGGTTSGSAGPAGAGGAVIIEY